MSDYFVHERAWCESPFIGRDTRIWAFSHVMKGARIGSGCNICEHCFIENNVNIGNDVTVKNGISIWDGITIEDKVFLGPHMVFTNDFKPRSKVHDYVQLKTLVKKGATLGANVTVIGGISIGEYSMTGAGSVLTRDVPSYAMFYGNPAKFKYWICECAQKLNFINDRAECVCGKKYILIDGGCEVLIEK